MVMIRGDADFEDALDDALNYQAIKKDPQRISKLKPYINKYNWKEIDFPAGPKDWIRFERNNKTIALALVLQCIIYTRQDKNNKCCIYIRI